MGDPLNLETTLGPCVKVSVADELRDLVQKDSKQGIFLMKTTHPCS